MQFLFQYRRVSLVIVLLLASMLFLIVSCVPVVDSPIISPKLGAALASIEKGGQMQIPPTPTPVLVKGLTLDQLYAGLPADIAAAMKTANPKNADALATQNACKGCHSLDPNANPKPTGPTWYHLGDTAGNRVPGESPALYLYTSITNPSAFVVPGYPDNIMIKTFGQTLSKQDIADLIAYLLEQHQ